jgi:hypothetical protein
MDLSLCQCESLCELNTQQKEIKEKLQKKWKNDLKLTCGNFPPSKGNQGGGRKRKCIEIEGEKIVTDECKICNNTLPLYCFHMRSENYLDVESGKESCCMSCISCRKEDAKKRGKEESEIMRQMIKTNNGDLTIEWLKQQLEKQHNLCHITNLPIQIIKGYFYSASVQNNGEGNLHYQDNCVLIMQCLQVQEHAILNLKDAWKQILLMMKKEDELATDTTQFLKDLDIKFSNTPKQNGVTARTLIYKDEESVGMCNKITSKTGQVCDRVCVKYETVCWRHLPLEEKHKINKNPEYKNKVTNIKKIINPDYSSQCTRLHLPIILRDHVERYYSMDKRSRGRHDKQNIVKLVPKDIIQKLHEQKGKCYLSGVPFSFNRDDPNYWSLERLDNTKHHTIENTVLICRIMNGATQLTREIIQQIYNEYKSLEC